MELAVAFDLMVLGIMLMAKVGDVFASVTVRVAEVFGAPKFIASAAVK